MRRETGLLMLLAFVLWGGCSTPTLEEKRQEHTLELATSVKEEKAVGREMAARLAGAFGIYDKAEVTQYINLVGLTVAARSSRPEIVYRFAILKTEEVNALATPGGYIFVTLGLLRSLRNESELAGILGHEIAHVTERHMFLMISPKRDVSATETLTRFLSRGGADLGFSLGKAVAAGMDLLLEKGLGPEKESEADAIGITYALAAGYQPESLLVYLKDLSIQKTVLKVSKTHPPFPERIASLTQYMDKNGINWVQKPQNFTQDRFDRMKRALQ